MNWTARIKAARANGGAFTLIDRNLANDWVTCACGEQDSRIPRYSSAEFSCGQPKDQELIDRGFNFLIAVNHDKPDDAARILNKIEERSIQILADLEYK